MSEGGYERWSEIRALLRLAGPMVLSQTAFVLMGLVDTAMSGHAGAQEQASLASQYRPIKDEA